MLVRLASASSCFHHSGCLSNAVPCQMQDLSAHIIRHPDCIWLIWDSWVAPQRMADRSGLFIFRYLPHNWFLALEGSASLFVQLETISLQLDPLSVQYKLSNVDNYIPIPPKDMLPPAILNQISHTGIFIGSFLEKPCKLCRSSHNKTLYKIYLPGLTYGAVFDE